MPRYEGRLVEGFGRRKGLCAGNNRGFAKHAQDKSFRASGGSRDHGRPAVIPQPHADVLILGPLRSGRLWGRQSDTARRPMSDGLAARGTADADEARAFRHGDHREPTGLDVAQAWPAAQDLTELGASP